MHLFLRARPPRRKAEESFMPLVAGGIINGRKEVDEDGVQRIVVDLIEDSALNDLAAANWPPEALIRVQLDGDTEPRGLRETKFEGPGRAEAKLSQRKLWKSAQAGITDLLEHE